MTTPLHETIAREENLRVHSIETVFKSTSPTRSPLPDKGPVSPLQSLPEPSSSLGTLKARGESQKLLNVLLAQLRSRPRPPAFKSLYADHVKDGPTTLGAVVESVRGAVRFQKSTKDSTSNTPTFLDADSDEDDGDADGFSTETALDYMCQLRDVLVISIARGWEIFDGRGNIGEPSDRTSSLSGFRFRRSIGRSLSPSLEDHSQSGSSDLLNKCLYVLQSIVSDDCAFRISSPSPLRPPFALQAVTLDVAKFLAHTQHNPRILSKVGFALLPAFSTFPSGMLTNLLYFFEHHIFRAALEDLGRVRMGHSDDSSEQPKDRSIDPSDLEIPVVAIQVEGPQDETAGRPSSVANLVSTRAPGQSMRVYHLSSLLSPFLAIVAETVNLTTVSPSVLQSVQRLLGVILSAKPDTYLDILDVVSYGTREASYFATCLLMSFWPKDVGHLTVGQPFPALSSSDLLALPTSQRAKVSMRSADHPYKHQFVPWRFDLSGSQDCRSCSTAMHDFGLLCPFCTCPVHFDCYDPPDGTFTLQYSLSTDISTQRLAMFRFSYVLPSRADSRSHTLDNSRHDFRLVNLFTLTLCCICRDPLWGQIRQGYKCSSCHQFVHAHCIVHSAKVPPCHASSIDSSNMEILWDALRASFLEQFKHMIVTDAGLATHSYEEVAVYHAVLWAQLNILTNGVLMGTISVLSDKPMTPGGLNEHKMDEFELHLLVSRYETYLSSGRCSLSSVLYAYMQEGQIALSEHTFMFDWPSLVYMTSVLKSPEEEGESKAGLLHVGGLEVEDQQSSPVEITSLGNIRTSVRSVFNMLSESATKLLLEYLLHLGLFERLDFNHDIPQVPDLYQDIPCAFGLPLGLDPSTDVELLVTAVAVYLADIDLSMNEVGFLLLIRRLWPNSMASEYGLNILARGVLAWIFAEHSSLEIIMREFVAKGLVLPGVRSGGDVGPWPSRNTSRPAGSNQNGGDYVAGRQLLLRRYAMPWISALHNQDAQFYRTIFDLTLDLVEEEIGEKAEGEGELEEGRTKVKHEVEVADLTLRYLVRLCQTCVPPSTLNELFHEWLRLISSLPTQHQALPSLARLFNRDADTNHRFSMTLDGTSGASDPSGSLTFDPWKIIAEVLQRFSEQTTEATVWLRVFSRSGVDIPAYVFLQFVTIAEETQLPLGQIAVVVESCFMSSWLRSSIRSDVQTLVSRFHQRAQSEVLRRLQAKDILEILRFIRQSLAICLLVYGCERSTLLGQGMVEEMEIQDLPSRRRQNARAPHHGGDAIVVDPALLEVLARYAEVNDDRVSSLVGRFLYCFITESRFLETHEIDNAIVRNGPALTSCAWQLYGVQNYDLSAVRISVLLRVMAVDSYPFHRLMAKLFDSVTPWELRFQGVTRLFRIILDCTGPIFNAAPIQWRSSVIDVFYYFFGALWTDQREEVRLAVESWSETLLPAHLHAISRCWNEALVETSVPERLKLINFLIQLHNSFPTWQALAWNVILKSLDLIEEKGQQSRPTELSNVLSVPLLVLALTYLAHGAEIDLLSLLTLKRHFARTIGFMKSELIPILNGRAAYVRYDNAIPEIRPGALPCLRCLPLVLDTYRPFELPPSCMGIGDDDRPCRILIGSIFVDVVLDLSADFTVLKQLPFMSAKNLLESLVILIHKHDLESKALRQFHGAIRKALRQAMLVVLSDLNLELRQLALAACDAYFKRWQQYAGNLSLETLETCASLVHNLDNREEDILINQATSLMATVMTSYAANGLLHSLFKRQLPPHFFVVLRRVLELNSRTAKPEESLRGLLLRDALDRLVGDEEGVVQVVLGNLDSYVQHVHHEGWSAEMMQHLSRTLILLTRRVMDWSGDAFDPEPLMAIVAVLLKHNKPHSRDLLLYMESALPAILGKFRITVDALSRLLRVSQTLQRRKEPVATEQGGLSHLTKAAMDVMSDVLRGKATISFSETLAAMLETSMERSATFPSDLLYLSTDFLMRIAADSLVFLFGFPSHVLEGKITQGGLGAPLAAARIILLAQDTNSLFLRQQVPEVTSQVKSPGYFAPIRAWNLLVLGSLSLSFRTARNLFSQFPLFSAAYSLALGGSDPQPIRCIDFSPEDINHLHVAVKVWLLLAQKLSLEAGGDSRQPEISNDDNTVTLVWNSLWPPFRRLLDSSEVHAQMDSSATLPVHIWSCIGDLFLFLLQSRSILSRESQMQIQALIRLATMYRAESLRKKLIRVQRGLSELPDELPFDALVSQTTTDVLAAERLHAVVGRSREDGRSGSEGVRREGRL